MKKSKIIMTAVTLAAVMGSVGCEDKKVSEPVSESSSEVVAEPVIDEEVTEPELPENWADMYDYVPTQNGYLGKAEAWLKNNRDYIGWVKINNTMVDYPVMFDPGEVSADNSYYGGEEYEADGYYLNHYWDRSQYRDGIPFMDWLDVFEGDEAAQSENIVIYGHNMASGNMFGTLARYRQNPNYYFESPFIQLSSRYEEYNYVIFAFLITPGSYNATDFRYWYMEELDNKEDFDFYVDNCHAKQMIDTGVDVQYGDKLLTLSTCYADYDNSRFIVVARRLRDGEKVNDLNSIQKTEAYLKAQQEKQSTENTSETANQGS